MSEPEVGKAMGSVLSTLRVLEEVAQRQPVGVSEIARVTEMPKSTVQRCLVTLRTAGWLRIVDTERSRWGVTSKPLGIGLTAAGEAGLRDVAGPYLESLRDTTNETIHFAVRDGNSLLILMRRDSGQAVRTYVEVGTRAPLHATSCGMAILAKMPPAEAEAALDGELKKYTDTTIVSRQALLEEVERTRARGYAVNDASWWRPDVCAIGAAVVNAAGKPIAALAVSVPSSRFYRQNETFYARHALDTAGRISKELHAT
ncbi:IclR family transcriptional regulator [Actinomadura madurae]|uniref:IclR family transcriptional regulator n=1 Tax=Actinomadura madurae TaxID=1993 RepID=UPI0020267F68|nr:IclR family transcriptional regulator [Actinomadura madurae]URN01162.1 IclR family transcriptional regulator [Actinomadura madurae]